MKNNEGFAVPLCLGIIVLLLAGGGIYFYQSKKVDTQKEGEVVQQNDDILLAPQVGLPSVVEAKRQEIYKAAVEKNYDKLLADFRKGDREFFETAAPSIVSVLQMPFQFTPYIPPSTGHPDAIEARYTWPSSRPDLAQLRIVITESGKWIYVGGGN